MCSKNKQKHLLPLSNYTICMKHFLFYIMQFEILSIPTFLLQNLALDVDISSKILM